MLGQEYDEEEQKAGPLGTSKGAKGNRPRKVHRIHAMNSLECQV